MEFQNSLVKHEKCFESFELRVSDSNILIVLVQRTNTATTIRSRLFMHWFGNNDATNGRIQTNNTNEHRWNDRNEYVIGIVIDLPMLLHICYVMGINTSDWFIGQTKRDGNSLNCLFHGWHVVWNVNNASDRQPDKNRSIIGHKWMNSPGPLLL